MMLRNQSAHTNPLLVGRELAPQHKGYLAERGVSLEVAKAAGLVSITAHEAKELFDLGSNDGLLIPYPGPDDFGRLRLDEPFKDKKGKLTRFLTPKGEEVRPYLPKMLAEVWQDITKPLCIVEGPIKALALVGIGLAAIGLAGVRTGHQKGADVVRLHDSILDKVKLLNRRVVILFDAGKATNKEVLAADKKQAELYAIQGAQVFVATLPLTDDGKDQGPDDFLARHGADRLGAIIDAAKPLKEAYPQEEKPSKKTQAQMLIELVRESGSLWWRDNAGVLWATFETNGHVEHHKHTTEAIKSYLRQLADTRNFIPAKQAIQDAIATLEMLTPRSAPFPVFVRIGEKEGKLYLDLGSPDWSAVEVDQDGWRKVATPPVRFRRAKGMMELPTPVKGGDLAELRRFLNTPEETEWRFLVAWLLAALRAKGPYPIAVLQGEHGCAKSTTARILRALVDPNSCPLRSSPRKEQDLAIAASNGWVVAYDNLSGLSQDLSDALSRTSTGGGFATRSHYENEEETLFDYQRPVLLNGIDEIATREDLGSRALLVTLPRIEEEQRREESDVWREFEEARPRILGALLDVVSAGLRRLPSVKPRRLPRMADFAKWLSACEEPLGWEPGSFLAAYFGSITQMAENAVEGDLFSRLVIELIEEKTEWKGSAAELLTALNSKADEAAKRVKGWPQDATRTNNKLRRIAPSLLKVGVNINRDKLDPVTRRKLISLSKTAKALPPTSQLGILREEKEKLEESTPFRQEATNSLRSLRSLQSPTPSDEPPKAERRLPEDCENSAFGANPVESDQFEDPKATKAEKRIIPKQHPLPRSDLNNHPALEEEPSIPGWELGEP